MKIAYTGWTWLINHQDNYKWEFEQFLKEVADLGYQAVENFAFITKYFDNNAGEVNTLLEKHHLELANLYEHFTDDAEVDYQSAVEYVDLSWHCNFGIKLHNQKTTEIHKISIGHGYNYSVLDVGNEKLRYHRRIVVLYSFFNFAVFESICNMAILLVKAKSRQPRVSFSLVIGSASVRLAL